MSSRLTVQQNLYNPRVQADTIPPTRYPEPLQPTCTGWHHTAHPLSWTSTTDLYRLAPYRPPFILNLYNRLLQAGTIPPTLYPEPLQPTSTGWHHTAHPLSWTSTTDFYRMAPYRPPFILNLYNRLLQDGTIPPTLYPEPLQPTCTGWHHTAHPLSWTSTTDFYRLTPYRPPFILNLYNRLLQADTIPPTLYPEPLQPTSTGWHHTTHPSSWTSTTDLYRLTPYRPPSILNLSNRLVQADTIPPTLYPEPLQPTSTGWHHTAHPLSWTSTTDFYRLTPYRPPFILNLYNRLLQADTIPPTLYHEPLQPTSTGWHHTAHPLSWTSTTHLYRLTPYRPPFILNLYNPLVQADTIPPTLYPEPLQPTCTGWHHTAHPLSWTSTTDFYRLTPYRPPFILNLYNRLLQADTIPPTLYHEPLQPTSTGWHHTAHPLSWTSTTDFYRMAPYCPPFILNLYNRLVQADTIPPTLYHEPLQPTCTGWHHTAHPSS